MHGGAGLEFGGLAVGDPDRGNRAVTVVAMTVFTTGNPDWGHPAGAGQGRELAFDGLLGAPPQFPGCVVPHCVRVVVVAVRAQRLADPHVAEGVACVAGQRAAVLAGATVAAGVARFRPASAPVRSAQAWRVTTRTWTGPKLGAVNVANTAG
jgi:hypothetical protein